MVRQSVLHLRGTGSFRSLPNTGAAPRVAARNWRPRRLFTNQGLIIIVFPPYAHVN
jgi:hypothetical protein